MDDGAPVSMIESCTHKDHPRKHGRKIFFVFVAVFAILVIGLLVATYLSSSTSTRQEVAPFYEGFYGLQNYKITDGSYTEPLKSVGVVERNANHLNVASEDFTVPFINHFASLAEEAPSRSRDMFILGIGARANPDTYKSDDYFSQFDEMTKRAKRNPRTNIAFKLQKRRNKKQLKQHS